MRFTSSVIFVHFHFNFCHRQYVLLGQNCNDSCCIFFHHKISVHLRSVTDCILSLHVTSEEQQPTGMVFHIFARFQMKFSRGCFSYTRLRTVHHPLSAYHLFPYPACFIQGVSRPKGDRQSDRKVRQYRMGLVKGSAIN